MTMPAPLPFPRVCDEAEIYRVVALCGRRQMSPEASSQALSDAFRKMLPAEAGKEHARVLAEYIGATLVGHSMRPKEEALRHYKESWDYAWKVQADGDVGAYLPSADAPMYAILDFLRYVHFHHSHNKDPEFTTGMNLLVGGPLAKWIGEDVVLDFDEEGWNTSKPQKPPKRSG